MQEQEALEQSLAQEQVPVEPPAEKMLTQDQVNKIVQREKENASVKARREVEQEYQQKMEQAKQIPMQQAAQNENVSREVDADAIYQQVQERINAEMQQKQFETEMSGVANSYLSKVDAARGSYEDFDAITAKFDASKFPQLVYLVSGLENGGSVIYDLAKNPTKLAAISVLAKEAPEMALQELQSLAQSISLNKEAVASAGNFESEPPLDRLNPSRVSGSNGEQSVNDLRSMPWLRG